MITTSEPAVRVSVAALLRVPVDEHRLILLDTGGKVVGPPGGGLAYYPAARDLLADLGWHPERAAAADGRTDLRGQLPERSLRAFLGWLGREQDRESGQQCLLRELAEELAEAGRPELVEYVPSIELAHVGTYVELPAPVAGKPYAQTRHLVVYELLPTGGTELRDRLVALATDPAAPTVIAAGRLDIACGRTGSARIGTQAAYLATGTHTLIRS